MQKVKNKRYELGKNCLLVLILWLIVFILLFLLLGKARAADISDWEFRQDVKQIRLNGSCKNKQLTVQVFFASSSAPFYTAGAFCQNDRYAFQDDLGYWKIAAGAYRVAVEDDAVDSSAEKEFIVEDLAVLPPTVAPPSNSSSGTAEILLVADSETASTTAEIFTSDEPSSGFLARIIEAIVNWLKSAVLAIKELVVEKVTTPELCLGKTCIVEDQLKDLLGGKSRDSVIPPVAGQKIEASAPEPEIQMSAPSSAGDATTTAN